MSGTNSESRQTSKGGAESQLTVNSKESCSESESDRSEEKPQRIQQKSDQTTCDTERSEVGELYV